MLYFQPNIRKGHLTFEQVLEHAKAMVSRLPDCIKAELKDSLEHGLGSLRNRNELDCYLAEYGEIHQAKLLRAFSHLPAKIWAEDKVSIIDYGCGQGVAEMVFSDFLRSKWKDNDSVKDITLIEPSKEALSRARDYVSSFFPQSRVAPMHECAESLSVDSVRPMCRTCIHIFSNVLDIPDFPINKIASIINHDNSHNHIVVCVSPFYQESARGRRLTDFGEMLNGFTCHYKFQKHTEEWHESYSCQIRIFVSAYF